MKVIGIILIVLGVAVLCTLVATMIYFLRKKDDHKDNSKVYKGQRIWGNNVRGGREGIEVENEEACSTLCSDTDGWGYWLGGKKCWCVNKPFHDPPLTKDNQWVSGTQTSIS